MFEATAPWGHRANLRCQVTVCHRRLRLRRECGWSLASLPTVPAQVHGPCPLARIVDAEPQTGERALSPGELLDTANPSHVVPPLSSLEPTAKFKTLSRDSKNFISNELTLHSPGSGAAAPPSLGFRSMAGWFILVWRSPAPSRRRRSRNPRPRRRSSSPRWAPPPPRTRRCAAPPTARSASGSTSYIPDVCGAIETAAGRNGLDPDFFARLIWKESLSRRAPSARPGRRASPSSCRAPRSYAASPTRSTRPRRSPRRATSPISAAARQHRPRGGGLQRRRGAGRALHRRRGRPALETRAYVQAITGHSAEAWRDAPPA